MELISCIDCEMSKGSIIIPVDGDFIVVGRVDGVGWDGLYSDGICLTVVAAFGFMLSIKILLSWRIFLQETNICVRIAYTSWILDDDGIRIGCGIIIIDILIVVMEVYTDRPIIGPEFLVDLSSPLN